MIFLSNEVVVYGNITLDLQHVVKYFKIASPENPDLKEEIVDIREGEDEQ